jgi:hypothetical protein
MRTLDSKSDRDSILRRISTVTPSDSRRWGRMSADQMICHLSDSYKAALGEKQVSAATGFLQRTVLKWVALTLPAKWPKGVSTRPEMEQGVGGTAPAIFEQDRAELISVFKRFCGETANLAAPHPIFGPMSRKEWRRWGYLHADHHLRQFGR